MQKGKSSEMNLPLMKKRYHKIFEPLIFTLLLQKHAIQLEELGWMISQVF